MSNRIKGVHIFNGRLTPAEAEIWITVATEHLTSTTQVVGRLVGPRCPYANTVEVAYPLREHSRQYETDGVPGFTLRVIIPEPNLWEPQTPFLYQGTLELWQQGERCDTFHVSHGLAAHQKAPSGLRWNGRPLTLRGVWRVGLTPAEARALHGANWNTVVAPVTTETASLWEMADRFGFLMIGRTGDRSQLGQARDRWHHISCLGWLLDPKMFLDPLAAAVLPGYLEYGGQLVGLEMNQLPMEALPEGLSFVAAPEELLSALGDLPVSKLALRQEIGGATTGGSTREMPSLLGWIANWPIG
jgi:hypothetical protein